MKKTLAMLLVLALVAPAMAVEFTASDATGGVLKIDYTLASGEALRGLALKLTRTSGDAVVAAGADVAAPAFNTFIDYAFSNPTGYDVGIGHPVANPAAAGVAALPASEFSISVGFLDQDGAQAGITTNGSITVQLTGDGESCFDIELDTLRGGVVGDNVVAPAAGWKINQCVVIGGVVTCRDRLTAAEQTQWDAYVAAQPGIDMSSWCWQFQCRGDADNKTETLSKYRVYNADLNLLVANWKAKYATANPVADFNHATETLSKYCVYNADLNLLVANWKAKDAALTNCPGYVAE
ncbi:MAG: hypothetical protein JXB18_07535 [Sedimentisphaerales bacterium]|nr:hypothetical protein [Sedimentisphaerales bacterium]